MKPLIVCCVPEMSRGFPSGWAWAHARTCPEHPRQKVRERTAAEDRAREIHPAGKGGGWK
jgi:hypothetical protein